MGDSVDASLDDAHEAGVETDPYWLFAVNVDTPKSWKHLSCPFVWHPYYIDACPCGTGVRTNNDEEAQLRDGVHKHIFVDYVSFCKCLWLDPDQPITDFHGHQVEVQFPWTCNQYTINDEDKTEEQLNFMEPDMCEFDLEEDPFAYHVACGTEIVLPLHKQDGGGAKWAELYFKGQPLAANGKLRYLDRTHPTYYKWWNEADDNTAEAEGSKFTHKDIRDVQHRMDGWDEAASKPRKRNSNSPCGDTEKTPNDEPECVDEDASDHMSIHSGSEEEMEECPDDVHCSEWVLPGEAATDAAHTRDRTFCKRAMTVSRIVVSLICHPMRK